MFTGSPRDTVMSSILGIITMSFLAGMFIMIGVQKAAQGDNLSSIGAFVLIPLSALAIVLHGRRILKAAADRG
jgi:predicted Na+-dependent transporter